MECRCTICWQAVINRRSVRGDLVPHTVLSTMFLVKYISIQLFLFYSDIGYVQFGNIWRPACLLNNNLWQKWFHADRVGVIFKHDDPLNLFAQKFESRIIKYSSTGLQCRRATNTLFNFLKTYCSFVLIENHSYIKFLLPKYVMI
jgi:hypothetical protein